MIKWDYKYQDSCQLREKQLIKYKLLNKKVYKPKTNKIQATYNKK